MVDDVIVAVPAHDEADQIVECLEAVARAAHAAVATGAIGRALIAVAAHRCSDDTAWRARSTLAALTERIPTATVIGLVHPDEQSRTVGDVRAGVIAVATERFGIRGSDWIFNTDADSIVPTNWISATLQQASTESAMAVAGMVTLSGWTGSTRSRRRYRKILRAGITNEGHQHVYGANLAVRWDAYCRAGGFPSVKHGEDSGLVESLRTIGERIATTFTPLVVTSGRVPGRADHGLGALLGRLEDSQPTPTTEVVTVQQF